MAWVLAVCVARSRCTTGICCIVQVYTMMNYLKYPGPASNFGDVAFVFNRTHVAQAISNTLHSKPITQTPTPQSKTLIPKPSS